MGKPTLRLTYALAAAGLVAGLAVSAFADGTLTPAQTGVVNKTAPFVVAGVAVSSTAVSPEQEIAADRSAHEGCREDGTCQLLPRLPSDWHNDYEDHWNGQDD